MITGGSGADILRGNGGADKFDFNGIAESKVSAPDKSWISSWGATGST